MMIRSIVGFLLLLFAPCLSNGQGFLSRYLKAKTERPGALASAVSLTLVEGLVAYPIQEVSTNYESSVLYPRAPAFWDYRLSTTGYDLWGDALGWSDAYHLGRRSSKLLLYGQTLSMMMLYEGRPWSNKWEELGMKVLDCTLLFLINSGARRAGLTIWTR